MEKLTFFPLYSLVISHLIIRKKTRGKNKSFWSCSSRQLVASWLADSSQYILVTGQVQSAASNYDKTKSFMNLKSVVIVKSLVHSFYHESLWMNLTQTSVNSTLPLVSWEFCINSKLAALHRKFIKILIRNPITNMMVIFWRGH